MLVARPGISRRMVGRERALTELRHLLDRAREEDRPQVAFLTGEAGIGKTRLLRELLAGLEPRVGVLAGQAREADAERPFALVRDAVEQHLPDDGQLPEQLRRWWHPLAHLLAPLVPPPHERDASHRHEMEELTRAGVALVHHLLEPAVGVVVFEDLHWAEGESLEVFERLARGDVPLLLVGSFRTEEFDRRMPLAELLASLERERAVSQVPIERLARDEVAELLEQALGAPVASPVIERFHRRTQGNPFFIEELLATAAPSADAPRPDPGARVEAALPWNTSQAVLRRLDDLEERTRRVLYMAAELGDRFSLSTLADVSELGTDAVLDTLREALRVGVLEERGSSGFAFRHALTREALAAELIEPERQRVHERALISLLSSDSPPAGSLAHHAAAAGRPQVAAEHAREAAEEAFHGGAPRNAYRLARIAVEHGQDDPGLRELLSRAAVQFGDFQAASHHAYRWMELAAEAGDTESQVSAGCHLAWTRWWTGQENEAWEALEDAIHLAGDLGPCRAAADVGATHARFLHARRQPTEAVGRAQEAAAVAQAVGADRTLVRAWMYESVALLDSPAHQDPEHLARAATLADRCLAEARRLDDIEVLAPTYHHRLVPDQPDDIAPERLLELHAEASEVADRFGSELLAGKLAVLEVHLTTAAGDRAAAERALASARRADLSPAEANWRARLAATLALEAGDLSAALKDHAMQHDLLGPPFEAEAQMDTAVVEAAIAAVRADAAGGEAGLRRASRALGEVCLCVVGSWWEVGIAALEAGVEPALVRSLMTDAAPAPVPRHAGIEAHLRGTLLTAEGAGREAVLALRQALDAPRNGRPATLLADAHQRLAEHLGADGDRHAALAHAHEALELLSGWPGPRRDAAAALLRRLGDSGDAPHELFTPRELEVVALLARGFSNGEIGERLFITTKTVSTHVSNILTKTGFTRRTQVAAWAHETGFLDQQSDR